MSSKLLFTLVGCAWLLIGRAASYSLTMTPAHVKVSEAPETVSFTCSADVYLAGCQFTWWDHEGKAGPLLDLTRGSLSQANSAHLTSALTGYSYSGRGLESGDCGVTLNVTGGKLWMVACRVLVWNGAWTYAWANLYGGNWAHAPHTLTPREAVVLPGGEARFALKAQGPLDKCHFHPPGLSLYFDQGVQSRNSAGRHRYLGAGLQSGECGLAVSHVGEEDNGPVWCRMELKWSMDTYRFMTLIVAHPPSAPTLSVVYTDAGVTATCEVPEARPVANISWVLGDYFIRYDSLDDSAGTAQDAWRWPWMKGSVLQRLTLTRESIYNGKVLKCVVSHVTLARPLVATENITFT